MKVKQSTLALAVAAALPLAAHAAPRVSFVAPASGQTLSGVINQSSACEVRGSSDIRRVIFYLDGTQLNTEGGAPWNCNIDTRNFSDGAHTLRAVAYDSRGASTATQISVSIANNTSGGGTSAGPTVQFTAPAEGGALSGNVQGPPSCVVTGTNISRVMFYLNDVWTNTDGNADNGLGCWIDTTRYADGAYTVRAVAYDSAGRTASATRSIRIQNTQANTPPSVSFRAPANGATVRGTLSGSACEALASDSNGIRQVQFLLDGAPLNTELGSPYNCSLDTTRFTDGAHTLTAVATDAAGATGSAQISLNVANGTGSASGPTVQFTAPAEGGALSGNVQGPPNCVVTGTNIARVMFYLNDQWTNTDGNLDNGLGCWIDTTRYADGPYTVRAVAYDASGNTATATRSIVIRNAAAANASPTVSFRAPTAGTTLQGLVNSTTCEANAADSDGSVSKVDFYLGSTFVNSKTAAPWQCAIDTTRFADGAHTLMAVATDNAGASASTQVAVSIDNSTSSGGGSTGTAISSADIVYAASADTLFSQQSGYTAQVIGTYTSAPSIPETGIHGTVLSNGESLRLGKSADPTDSSRKALTFQLSPSDPTTSGSKRSEISFTPRIEHNKVYWTALRVYVHNWGTLSSSDSSVFGTQLHSGDNSRGLSPSFSLISNGGADFQVYALYSTSSSPSQSTTVTTRSPRFALPFGRWVDFVFKFRQNTSGSGFLQVWMDGTQIVDYRGSLGFNTPGYLDYMKFGYYNWSSAFNSPRKVQLRSPVTVVDPTGSKYTPDDLRAYLRGQP